LPPARGATAAPSVGRRKWGVGSKTRSGLAGFLVEQVRLRFRVFGQCAAAPLLRHFATISFGQLAGLHPVIQSRGIAHRICFPGRSGAARAEDRQRQEQLSVKWHPDYGELAGLYLLKAGGGPSVFQWAPTMAGSTQSRSIALIWNCIDCKASNPALSIPAGVLRQRR
jgi:hypothetical protein